MVNGDLVVTDSCSRGPFARMKPRHSQVGSLAFGGSWSQTLAVWRATGMDGFANGPKLAPYWFLREDAVLRA